MALISEVQRRQARQPLGNDAQLTPGQIQICQVQLHDVIYTATKHRKLSVVECHVCQVKLPKIIVSDYYKMCELCFSWLVV